MQPSCSCCYWFSVAWLGTAVIASFSCYRSSFGLLSIPGNSPHAPLCVSAFLFVCLPICLLACFVCLHKTRNNYPFSPEINIAIYPQISSCKCLLTCTKQIRKPLVWLVTARSRWSSWKTCRFQVAYVPSWVHDSPVASTIGLSVQRLGIQLPEKIEVSYFFWDFCSFCTSLPTQL